MHAQWQYEQDGQWIGPVSVDYLQALLNSGELKRETAVRRAGVAVAAAAGQTAATTAAQAVALGDVSDDESQRSAAPPAIARSRPRADQAADSPASPLARGTRWLRRSFDAVTEESKAAGQLAARLAERWRLEQGGLRSAYLALGQSVRRENRFRADFARLHEQLDGIAARIARLRRTPPPDREFPSLWDRTRAAAGQAVAAPQVETLTLRAKQLLRELGKAAYEKHGALAGPDAAVRPLREALDKVDALTRDIDRLSRTPPGRLISPRRAAARSFRAAKTVGEFLSRSIPKIKSAAR